LLVSFNGARENEHSPPAAVVGGVRLVVASGAFVRSAAGVAIGQATNIGGSAII